MSQPPTAYFRPADKLRTGDWLHVWGAIDKRFAQIEEMDAATLGRFIEEVSSFELYYIGWHTPHNFDDHISSILAKARARLRELSSEKRPE